MTFLALPVYFLFGPSQKSKVKSRKSVNADSSRRPVNRYLLSPISYLLSPISNSACQTRARECASSRAGQAMVEFVIAILAVVIIVAGFFQLMEIVGERGKILRSIRGETGKKALSPGLLLDRPDYIREWKEGEDEFRHTADDESVSGSISVTLGAGVVEHSVSDSGDWTYLDNAVNSDLASLRGGLSAAALGLVHEKETEKIYLMPAMRNWIVGKEYVLVGSELWMPRLKLGEFDQ